MFVRCYFLCVVLSAADNCYFLLPVLRLAACCRCLVVGCCSLLLVLRRLLFTDGCNWLYVVFCCVSFACCLLFVARWHCWLFVVV